MSDVPKEQLFKHQHVVDRDKAIAFMKLVGFEPTADVDTFARDTERSANQANAGARALVAVSLSSLLNSKVAWRHFVERWSRKLANGKV